MKLRYNTRRSKLKTNEKESSLNRKLYKKNFYDDSSTFTKLSQQIC